MVTAGAAVLPAFAACSGGQGACMAACAVSAGIVGVAEVAAAPAAAAVGGAATIGGVAATVGGVAGGIAFAPLVGIGAVVAGAGYVACRLFMK